jgi:hypothetical protein
VGAEETYPWGDAELVAKVGGKAFAFVNLGGGTVGVTCGRDAPEAGEWRDRYPGTVRTSSYVAATGGTPSAGPVRCRTTTCGN